MTDATTATTVTVLTPPGRGAVASIEVRGPRATELVGQFFTALSGKPLEAIPLRRIAVGRWKTDAGPGEELVVCRFADSRVEVHCHGGPAAVEAIVQSLELAGARRQSPESWGSEEADRVVAEARLALGEAKTERTALILLDQYHGALNREVTGIVDQLRSGQLEDAAVRLSRLCELSEIGLHLATPWRVAIAGRPNVGKSSLMNALVGYSRSIVFDQPGTTRDVVTASAVLDGWPVELADMAGLRETVDAVESAGVRFAHEQLSQADLILQVRDASQPSAVESLPGPRVLTVWNKIDLCRNSWSDAAGVPVSALTGQGIERLIASIVRELVPAPPERSDAVPFAPRQIDLLAQALKLAQEQDPQASIDALQRLWS